MELREFYDFDGNGRAAPGEYACRICEFTSPHEAKAVRHAWYSHGVVVLIESSTDEEAGTVEGGKRVERAKGKAPALAKAPAKAPGKRGGENLEELG